MFICQCIRTKGGHVEVNAVYHIFHKVSKLLGRDDIGTHTLRKTFGYQLLQKDQRRGYVFGLSSKKIAKRYIGINEVKISETLLNFRLGL